jgi:hypothetical protein
VCRPARISTPTSWSRSRSAVAQRIAAPGLPKVARMPSLHQLPRHPVVGVEEPAPPAVPDPTGPLGGADDVGEQHGGEQPLAPGGRRRGILAVRPPASGQRQGRVEAEREPEDDHGPAGPEVGPRRLRDRRRELGPLQQPDRDEGGVEHHVQARVEHQPARGPQPPEHPVHLLVRLHGPIPAESAGRDQGEAGGRADPEPPKGLLRRPPSSESHRRPPLVPPRPRTPYPSGLPENLRPRGRPRRRPAGALRRGVRRRGRCSRRGPRCRRGRSPGR